MASILIADDIDSERRLVTSVLEEAGHKVVTAKDGEDALAKLKQSKPDLAILDVVMPGKTGFEVCRDIKKSAEFSKVPVILLTSKDGDSDKFWGQRQGANEYLTKPFEPAQLLAVVRKYV